MLGLFRIYTDARGKAPRNPHKVSDRTPYLSLRMLKFFQLYSQNRITVWVS